MKKLTHRLFVRHESETEYRNWDELNEDEVKQISECMIREAAASAHLVPIKNN